MKSADKRILSAIGLLCIFTLSLYLRLYGIDWAFKDGNGSTPHPDERHYQSCFDRLRPQGLSAEERQLPWREQFQLLYQRNINIDPSIPIDRDPGQGLRPVNYNYGTFPLYLYALYRTYLVNNGAEPGQWGFLNFDWLGIAAVLLSLFIGVQLFRAIRRDFQTEDRQKIPWYKDHRPLLYFFPSLILPFVGLMLMIMLPTALNEGFARYSTQTISLLLIGRILTAWFGALTVLLAYLIGRDAYNRTAGIIAALMLATAMLHVQTSHFATVDVIVGFWSTAAVYCFLKISQKPRLVWYLLGAICVGFGIATKWSGITLPGILFLAHAIATWGDERQGKVARWIHTFWLAVAALVLLHFFRAASSVNPTLNFTLAQFRDFYWNYAGLFSALVILFVLASIVLLYIRDRWHNSEVGWFWPSVQIYRPWLWLLLCIPVGILFFYIGAPLAYVDAQNFANSIAEQNRIIVTGAGLVPYTLQFRNTPGVFYFIDNLFYPSLDWITAFFVVAGMVYATLRIFFRATASDLLLVAWVVPSLLLYGTFHAKFPRYLDTILPVMAVFGGRLLSDLISIRPYFYMPGWPTASVGTKRLARNFGIAGAAISLLCGLVYGWAYIGIYDQPHTYTQARTYYTQNAKPGATVTQNSWDEGWGVHIEGNTALQVHTSDLDTRDPDQRTQYFAEMLERFDYIVFPSKRGYGTTLLNPDLYPVTNRFLSAFFAEQLGFRVAKVITVWPKFLWWEFRTDEEDETADIYDHPKVVIFEKVKPLSVDALKAIVQNPPGWVNDITPREILRLSDGYPVYYEKPTLPVFRWWLAMQVLGCLAFVLLFPICSPLPDRGYAIGKIVGLALFSWVCWFLASLHVFPLSRLQGLFVLLAFAALALNVGLRWKKELGAYLKQRWLLLLSYELLFLVLWGIFLWIKAYHPAAIWGEKPMNFAFINSVYRTDYFPPEDPWVANYGINYYYYGHAVLAIVGRFIDLPASYLFNIGGTSVSALVGLAIFSLVYTLSRRVWVTALATYLCLFAGHIFSYIRLVQFTNGYQEVTLWGAIVGFYKLLGLMFKSVSVYLGITAWNAQDLFSLQGYDSVFWPSAHNSGERKIVFGAMANEFPSWMHLFLDFHAHMLVMPFVWAYMTLLYVWFTRPQREMSHGVLGGLLFFLALLLGSVTCINTWDLPACMIGLLFIGALKFWRESELVNSPLRPEWLNPTTGQSLLHLPIGPVLAVAALSIGMMYPFHYHFVSRVNSVKVMTEGQTPIVAYLGLWGHILVPVLVGILLFFILRRDGMLSLKRTLVAVGLFVFFVLAAVLVTHYNSFGFPPHHPPGPPLNYLTPGLFLPFLAMLFFTLWQRWREPEFIFVCLLGLLGLGISIGIEFLYIWEGWAVPEHRANTVFKFNLQVWHYLSIFAAFALLYGAQHLRLLFGQLTAALHRMHNNSPSVARRVIATSAYYLVFVLFNVAAFASCILILPTLPFAVTGPYMISLTGGAISRDARGNIPNLDGLDYLRKESYESYAAVLWFNRFVPGTPNIIELVNKEYFEFSRFCTNTGLPALLGWAHHVGERIHFNKPERDHRRQLADLVYTASEKEPVLSILGRYDIEYLVFGELEMTRKRGDRDALPPFGPESLKRFEKWGDVFRLVYRYGDTSIFRIDQSLNRAYGIQSADEVPAQPQLPPAMRPPDPTASMYEGITQSGQVIFAEPRGVTVDIQGKVYVADSFNHKLQVFLPDGSRAWQVGKKGNGELEFMELNDVTIDPADNNVYITDTWNQRIVRLNAMGEFVGASAISLFGPRGIAYHPGVKLLYIADTGNDQVVVMTPDGVEAARWGTLQGGTGDGDFREPVGIDITNDGNVIVVDSQNLRLKLYQSDGQLIRFWPIQTSTQPGQPFEGHVACDPEGKIYLTDPNEKNVHVYTMAGELVEKISANVHGQPMLTPLGVAIAPEGTVYVSDRAMNRIHKIR